MADEGARQDEGRQEELRCDFCGDATAHVRRVALDRDYDRLQTPHAERYACERCSREKEQERLGD
jgi:hypothetical protein